MYLHFKMHAKLAFINYAFAHVRITNGATKMLIKDLRRYE